MFDEIDRADKEQKFNEFKETVKSKISLTLEEKQRLENLNED